jgi:hypothetical protein
LDFEAMTATFAFLDGEVGSIDADPFTDMQDNPSLKDLDLKISVLSASAAIASVLADFDRDAGKREQLTYSLVIERGQWRVDDIRYSRPDGSTDTLRGLLRERLRATARILNAGPSYALRG